jgi:hypothetical protein
MMTERSARFALPFILPGQAQKEAFHTEALAALDALVHPAIEGPALAAPPASPVEGQCWVVAAGATGPWAGQQHKIACRTSGGWRFVAPLEGMKAWDKAAGHWRYWSGSGWSDGRIPAAGYMVGGQQVVGPRVAAVPSPSGGTIIDMEARAAVDALIVALKSHGLTD